MSVPFYTSPPLLLESTGVFVFCLLTGDSLFLGKVNHHDTNEDMVPVGGYQKDLESSKKDLRLQGAANCKKIAGFSNRRFE